MAAIRRDAKSFATHHLHMCFRETNTVLASGTGFAYEKDGINYLVTTWHNVTGRDPGTGACLSGSLAVPDMVSTMFREIQQPASCRREELALYRDSRMTKPRWYEHPQHGKSMDVVVIPVSERICTNYRLFAINAIGFDRNYKEEVADESFVIGYPFAETTHDSVSTN
jgi:hypothetical protein